MMHIETEKLIIRQLTENDLRSLVELDQDPDVMKFADSGNLISSLQTSRALKTMILGYRVTKFGTWGIELKGSEALIGTIAMLPLLESSSLEIACRIRTEFRGNGFATEAAQSLMKHFSENFEVSKFVATTHNENTSSKKVLEKLGFKLVGEICQGLSETDSREVVCWFEKVCLGDNLNLPIGF